MARTTVKVILSFALLTLLAPYVQAQTATYHLHNEASTTANLLQLKTAGPDAVSAARQSANLRNVAPGEYLIKEFDTQAGVPGASGVIPAGSTVTFLLWMRKSTSGGTLFPRAKLRLNGSTGTLLATATGATALTSTLTKYTFTATTTSAVTMSAADRFYLWVGVSLTAAPTTNTTAELDVEGTLGGNFDSLVTVPLPAAQPTISGLAPTAGPAGTSVTVSGSNFGATQGASTITFNGVAAAPTSWGNTTVVAAVPGGATTGPVVVTVGGTPSNGVTFTVGETGSVGGTVTRASDGSGLGGALVHALQAGVVKGSATSAPDGSYLVAGLQAGIYDVRAAASRFVTQVQAGVGVSPPGTSVADFSLVEGPPFTYVYDETGRLVAAVDPAGETALYAYDAVGNLLSISRRSSAQVSILEFTPDRGPVGSHVIIYGTGFSPTPGQNTIQFNGTAAAVTSSTETQLVTTVPAGATTGPITVTSPAGTATSGAAFTVGSSAPVITGFTPNTGTAGTSVSLTGNNFETTASGNRVAFNGKRAVVSSATSTTLAAAVPTGATSGRISVTTPNGTGTSSAYFFIPPAPLTAADVEVTGQMNIGETKVVTIATANKVAMILFDGTAGQRVSLRLTGVTISSGSVNVYKPDGGALGSASFNTGGGFIDTQTLPADGTYTILVDPSSTNVGSLTLELNGIVDAVGSITAGGPSATIATTVAGQNARLTFAGAAGQRVSVNGNSTHGVCWNLGVYKPDGTQLTNTFSCGSTIFIEPQALPVSGAYTVLIDPTGPATGQATISLYDVVDVNGTVTIGGPSASVSLPTPGQTARLTFEGSADQRISVNSSSTMNGCWNLGVYKPDGTQLTNTFSCGSTIFIEPQTLPVTGTYTLLVDPHTSATGSVTLSVFNVVDAGGTISIGGPSVTVTTGTPGQVARLAFDGAAGQRVSVNSSSTMNGCWNLGVYKPDGSQLTNVFSCGGSIFVEPQTLPASGTYTLLVDPHTSATGSATINLYNVADVTGTITVAGPSVNVTTTAPGQNASLTFSGAAGQQVTVRVAGSTMGCVRVTLLRPDNSSMTNTFSCGSSFNLATQTLPVDGTYKITIDPNGAAVGNISVSLTSP